MPGFWSFDSKMQSVGYNPLYTRLTGSLAAGVLLSQIVYWFRPGRTGKTKLRVHREGRDWLAKSRLDLMAECGLTEWKLRKAMDTLKVLGLVESEIHLFQGKTTPFIFLHETRLAEQVAQVVASELVPRKPHARSGGNLTTGCEETYRPLQETTTETTTETTSAGAAHPHGEIEPMFDITVEGEDDRSVETEEVATEFNNTLHKHYRKGSQLTLEEIQKAMEAKRAAAPVVKEGSVHPLVILWKKRVSAITGGFVKDLTKQELGQLKQLGQKLGVGALSTFDWMLSNWPEFVFEAKSLKGLGATPSQPVIGFALKYYDVAVQLIARTAVSVAKPSAPRPPPDCTMVPVRPQKTSQGPQKASATDIANALAMFAVDDA